MLLTGSDLDGDVHAGREIELTELINRLGGGFEDVEEALVGADLELVHRLFVNVRGAVDRELLDTGRKRDGSGYLRTCALGGLHNFKSGDVKKAEIEAFQSDADALSSGHSRSWLVFLVKNRGQYLGRDLFEVRWLHGVGSTSLGE